MEYDGFAFLWVQGQFPAGEVPVELVQIGIQAGFTGRDVSGGGVEDEIIRVLKDSDWIWVWSWFRKVCGKQGKEGSGED